MASLNNKAHPVLATVRRILTRDVIPADSVSYPYYSRRPGPHVARQKIFCAGSFADFLMAVFDACKKPFRLCFNIDRFARSSASCRRLFKGACPRCRNVEPFPPDIDHFRYRPITIFP